MHGSEGADRRCAAPPDLKSQEGVCESQRRARAKRRAYNDDPKAAAAEDFPKRQMIEIHVQMHMFIQTYHVAFSSSETLSVHNQVQVTCQQEGEQCLRQNSTLRMLLKAIDN